MTLRLPALVRHSPTPIVYLAYWIPFIALYQIANRWPVVAPRELSYTWLDQLVPFVPAMLPVYVGYLPLYWWTVARSEDDREVNRIFWAAHVQLLLSLPFFVLLPVRMPLERFYGPDPYNWADALWRWFDAPNNCFPSLHVSSCLLFLFFNARRPHPWVHGAAAVAVIASTVLVKQHYVIDLLGGAGVYVVSRAALRHMVIVGVGEDGWRVVEPPPPENKSTVNPLPPPAHRC